MPIDKMIFLGFHGPEDVEAALAAHGLATTDDEGNPITVREFLEAPDRGIDFDDQQFHSDLRRAYEDTVQALGWEIVNSDTHDYSLNTPWGRRVAWPYKMAIFFNQESKRDKPEDICFGLTLTAQPYPCLVDIPNEEHTLSPIVDLSQAAGLIATATKHINRNLPYFVKARAFLRDIDV